jgi:hypothetical protein
MKAFRAELDRARRTNEWDRVAFLLMKRFQYSSNYSVSGNVVEIWKGIQNSMGDTGAAGPRPEAAGAELARYLNLLSEEQTKRVQSILASLLTQVR